LLIVNSSQRPRLAAGPELSYEFQMAGSEANFISAAELPSSLAANRLLCAVFHIKDYAFLYR
jgi:hypothetical protein